MTTSSIMASMIIIVLFHMFLHFFLDALNNIYRSNDFIKELKYISSMKDGTLSCTKKAFRELCDRYEITEFPAFRTVYTHYIPDVNDKDFSCTFNRKQRKLIHACLLFIQLITMPIANSYTDNLVFLISAWIWAAASCFLLTLTGILSVEKELAIYNQTNFIKFTHD